MATKTQTWDDILQVDSFQKLPDVPLMESEAIQSQYDGSVRLKAFCKIFQDSIDATGDMERALRAVSDPNLAQGVFLDWWGERVGASRRLTVDGREVLLSDEQFRFLIFYKAAANIADSSIFKMNALLQQLLGVSVFVIDNLDMTISLRVIGELTETQEFIMKHYGLLTRGAGVGYEIVTGISTDVFGFAGSGLQPFNQAPFGDVTVFS